jgi:hypothetical protein
MLIMLINVVQLQILSILLMIRSLSFILGILQQLPLVTCCILVGFLGRRREFCEGSIYLTSTTIGKATKERFDDQLMGQTTWYLQSRITQFADYSIVLDQPRFAALIVERYLSNSPESDISTHMHKRNGHATSPAAITSLDLQSAITDCSFQS